MELVVPLHFVVLRVNILKVLKSSRIPVSDHFCLHESLLIIKIRNLRRFKLNDVLRASVVWGITIPLILDMILGLREKIGGFPRRSKVSTRVDFVRRRLLWGCILSINSLKLILLFDWFNYSFCELNLLIKQSSRCLLNQALTNIWIAVLLMNVKRSLRVDNVMSMGSLTWLWIWNTWQLSLF